MSFNNLDALDQAVAGQGNRSFFTKDTPPGTSITGTIVNVTTMQVTDYITKQPKTWDNGDPMLQAVVTIQTSLKDDAEDNGMRAIYIKLWGQQNRALGDAVRKTGRTRASEALTIGSTFTATFTSTAPSKMGSPTKLYEYNIQPAAVAQLDNAVAPASTPTAGANPWQTPTPTQASASTPQPPVMPTTTVGTPTVGDTPPDWKTQAQQLAAAGLNPTQIANALEMPADQVANLLTPPPF